ncbi:MAG: glycosyltransferase [Micrococcaceae bacterium]
MNDQSQWFDAYLQALIAEDRLCAGQFETAEFVLGSHVEVASVLDSLVLSRSHVAIEDPALLLELSITAHARGLKNTAARILRRIRGIQWLLEDISDAQRHIVEELMDYPLTDVLSTHDAIIVTDVKATGLIEELTKSLELVTTRRIKLDLASNLDSANAVKSLLKSFDSYADELHKLVIVVDADHRDELQSGRRLGQVLGVPVLALTVNAAATGGESTQARAFTGLPVGIWAPQFLLQYDDGIRQMGDPRSAVETTSFIRVASALPPDTTGASEMLIKLGFLLRDGVNFQRRPSAASSTLEYNTFSWIKNESLTGRTSDLNRFDTYAIALDWLWQLPKETRVGIMISTLESSLLSGTDSERASTLMLAARSSVGDFIRSYTAAQSFTDQDYASVVERLSSGEAPLNGADEFILRESTAALKLKKLLEESTDYAISSTPTSGDNGEEKIVCILHGSAPLQSGGYAIRAHGILRALRQRDVNIVAATRPGFGWDPERSTVDTHDGVDYHRLPDTGVPRELGEAQHMLSFIEPYERFLREQGATKVHVRSTYLIAVPAIIAAHRLGLKVVYEVSGLWELVYEDREKRESLLNRSPFATFGEVLAVRHADQVIVMNDAVRELSISRGADPDRLRVAPNAVDVTLFAPAPSSRGEANDLTVGYIGSFVDYEGIDKIVKAAADLKARGFSTNFRLVGDGQRRPVIEQLVEKYDVGDIVTLTGRVPHAQVVDEYRTIDILVYPRKNTGATSTVTPLKPFEALAMEKAVIVSDVAPLKEIAGDNERALVVRHNSSRELTEAIQQLLQDPSLREKLGRAGRAWVSEHRNWSIVVQAFLDAYAEL